MFPRILALREMQTAVYKVWTRVTVSIAYDSNPYTTNDYIYIYMSITRLKEIDRHKKEIERYEQNRLKER